MYSLDYTGKFKKDLKLCQKRGYDMNLIREVIVFMEEHGQAPEENKPHKLQGKLLGYWECHITPDWLLVWDQNDKELILLMTDTGTHSDLFGKNRK